MENIGEQLSRTRQAQGLSVSDVAARLRIRKKFVEALENEQWSTVGEFVYVRGFLKNYAELLGLDPGPLLVALRANYQPEQFARGGDGLSQSAYQSSRSARIQSNPWFPWVMGALTTIAGVLVVLVAISVIGFLSAANRTAGVQPSTQTSSAATPVGGVATGNALSSITADQNASGVNLRLELTQRSWLSVIVDGKRVVYETLPAGTIREFHGAKEITLRAGNAGGVVANIDGKNLGALGQAGQVEDRVFAVKTPVDQVNGMHE